MAPTAPSSLLQLRSSAGLYGADRMVLALNRALGQRGVQSRLLSINNYLLTSQPLHEAATAQGDDAVLLPCGGRLDLRTVRALVAELRVRRPAIVHVHDYKSALYAWLATRICPAPLVATLHGWVESSRSLRLYTRLELALLKRFDALAVVSSRQIERLEAAGVPRDRVRQIDNGIEVPQALPGDRAAFRSELGLGAEQHVLAAIGRLAPEKNLGQLLDVFSRIAAARPQLRLLVVGDGPLRAELERQAQDPALVGRVLFTGPRLDMGRVYAGIDGLVLPSLSEGMPLVVLEAMSFGLPIVASAVGDVPRLLSNSDRARLVPPGDAEALRLALLSATADAPGQDRRAREQVLRHHSTEAMADRYLDLYTHLLRGQHGLKVA